MSAASEPKLTVVVASVNGLPYLDDCLAALARNAPEAAVIVADSTDEPTRTHVRKRWPAAELISFDGQKTVPELRAAGVFAATTPFVALIEDHNLVRPGWAAKIVELHEQGHSVVGGPVENVMTGRLRDWSAFLIEYSDFMEPIHAGATGGLPGMNVSYDRRALTEIEPLLREGRWETWLHTHLLAAGFELHADPALTIDHAKDFGFGEFASQRFHYARSYAGMRNADLGWKRAVFALGSPLLPLLVYARIARNVFGRKRARAQLAAATPLIVVFLGVWSAGEAIGYALGGGDSLLRVR